MKRIISCGFGIRGRQGRNRCRNFRSRVGRHFRIGFVGIGSRASIEEWPVKGEAEVLIDGKGKVCDIQVSYFGVCDGDTCGISLRELTGLVFTRLQVRTLTS
jgi:hypothetical protein